MRTFEKTLLYSTSVRSLCLEYEAHSVRAAWKLERPWWASSGLQWPSLWGVPQLFANREHTSVAGKLSGKA